MRLPLIGFACGLLFAAGLGVSQMTQPSRIIGFLDFFGNWDPTLMFVMGGAIGVYLPVWWLMRGRKALAASKSISRKLTGSLDYKLFAGSALFGIGWGMAGICPGPGVVLLGRGAPDFFVFVGAMLGGMLLFRASQPRQKLAGEDG
jgi:uncharacterized membrane protein YedE/YeeE